MLSYLCTCVFGILTLSFTTERGSQLTSRWEFRNKRISESTGPLRECPPFWTLCLERVGPTSLRVRHASLFHSIMGQAALQSGALVSLKLFTSFWECQEDTYMNMRTQTGSCALLVLQRHISACAVGPAANYSRRSDSTCFHREMLGRCRLGGVEVRRCAYVLRYAQVVHIIW